jgi:hypothetical protein
MFLWNMLGALVLIPALSYFLLPSTLDARPKVQQPPPAQAVVVDVRSKKAAA